MLAAIKHPCYPWKHVNIEPNLKLLQDIVGGDLEQVKNNFTNAIMYCNEMGDTLRYSPNFLIYDHASMRNPIACIKGTVVMFGPVDEEGKETHLSVSLFEETIRYIKEIPCPL